MMIEDVFFIIYGFLFGFAFIKSFMFWYSWWKQSNSLACGYSKYPDVNDVDYVVSDNVAKIVNKKASLQEYMISRVIYYNEPKTIFMKLYMRHMIVVAMLFIITHLITLPKILFTEMHMSFSIVQISFAMLFMVSAYLFENVRSKLDSYKPDYVYVPTNEI